MSFNAVTKLDLNGLSITAGGLAIGGATEINQAIRKIKPFPTPPTPIPASMKIHFILLCLLPALSSLRDETSSSLPGTPYGAVKLVIT